MGGAEGAMGAEGPTGAEGAVGAKPPMGAEGARPRAAHGKHRRPRRQAQRHLTLAKPTLNTQPRSSCSKTYFKCNREV